MFPRTRCPVVATLRDPSQPLRVLLVDDEADLRRLARVVLDLDGRWLVVGEASDGAAAVELASRTHPDVVLLDLEMPWLDGAEALPGILHAAPGAVIAVWTSDLRAPARARLAISAQPP